MSRSRRGQARGGCDRYVAVRAVVPAVLVPIAMLVIHAAVGRGGVEWQWIVGATACVVAVAASSAHGAWEDCVREHGLEPPPD